MIRGDGRRSELCWSRALMKRLEVTSCMLVSTMVLEYTCTYTIGQRRVVGLSFGSPLAAGAAGVLSVCVYCNSLRLLLLAAVAAA